jgi:hypothetical protein
MRLSRQSLASVAELLGTLSSDSAGLLLYKHLGVRVQDLAAGAIGRLEVLETADPDAVWELTAELAREKAAIRAGVSPKYPFDGRWREVERWLLHDGWVIENNDLVRAAPAAEDATGVRDALIRDLAASNLDQDEGIRTAIVNSATAFVQQPPDYNASITNVRIALETTARRAAAKRAEGGGPPYSTDSWGSSLAYLKLIGILTPTEEEMLARVYTFISPGAHTPTGVTQEEWARLARTFGLGACFFLVKKHQAFP